MFYQLARTAEKVKRAFSEESGYGFGGVISVIVNYSKAVITMNILGRDSSFAGEPPDRWMYPGRRQ